MITPILQEYLTTRQGTSIDLSIPTKFRMSDAGKCRLMRYLKRSGKPFEQSHGNLFALEAGNVIHSWVENAVFSAGYGVESEGELEDEHRIGHFDLLLDVNEELVLVEVKTVNSKKMYYIDRQNAPDKQHLYQLVTYWEAIHTSSPILKSSETLSRAYIVYINRDNWQDIRELEVEIDRLWQEEVRQDWNILLDAWLNHDAPSPNPESWECHYCNYKNDCLGGTR